MSKASWSQLPKPPAPQGNPRRRRYFWAGISLCGFGFLVLSIAVGGVIFNVTRGLHRVSFPGSHTVKMREGVYVGLLDPQKSRDVTPERLAALRLSVQESATGYDIPVTMAPSPAPGTPGGPAQPLFQFETPAAGPYLIRSETDFNDAEIPVILVHGSMGNNRSDLIVGGIVCAVLCSAGVFLLVGSRRRSPAAG